MKKNLFLILEITISIFSALLLAKYYPAKNPYTISANLIRILVLFASIGATLLLIRVKAFFYMRFFLKSIVLYLYLDVVWEMIVYYFHLELVWEKWKGLGNWIKLILIVAGLEVLAFISFGISGVLLSLLPEGFLKIAVAYIFFLSMMAILGQIFLIAGILFLLSLFFGRTIIVSHGDTIEIR